MNERTKTLAFETHDGTLNRLDNALRVRPWLQADEEMGRLITDIGKAGGVTFGYQALQEVELLADRLKRDTAAARTDRERNALNAQVAGVLQAAEIVERTVWAASQA